MKVTVDNGDPGARISSKRAQLVLSPCCLLLVYCRRSHRQVSVDSVLMVVSGRVWHFEILMVPSLIHKVLTCLYCGSLRVCSVPLLACSTALLQRSSPVVIWTMNRLCSITRLALSICCILSFRDFICFACLYSTSSVVPLTCLDF